MGRARGSLQQRRHRQSNNVSELIRKPDQPADQDGNAHDVPAGRRRQQIQEILPGMPGRVGDLDAGGHHRAKRFGLDPAQAGQESEHGPVLGKDLRGEVIDPDLEGTLTQAGEQRGAKPAALPLINHRHSRVGGIGLVRTADEPALPHDLR